MIKNSNCTDILSNLSDWPKPRRFTTHSWQSGTERGTLWNSIMQRLPAFALGGSVESFCLCWNVSAYFAHIVSILQSCVHIPPMQAGAQPTDVQGIRHRHCHFKAIGPEARKSISLGLARTLLALTEDVWGPPLHCIVPDLSGGGPWGSLISVLLVFVKWGEGEPLKHGFCSRVLG